MEEGNSKDIDDKTVQEMDIWDASNPDATFLEIEIKARELASKLEARLIRDSVLKRETDSWSKGKKKGIDQLLFTPNDTLDPNVLNTLQEQYVFRDDPRDIWSFLKQYPLLPSVLVEAHHNLMKYFPNNPQVFLSVETDPEDGSQHLIASVDSGLDVDESMDTLEAFDRGWWSTRFSQTYGRLCITLE